MKAIDAKKLKELDKANSRLKTIVANLRLDVAMLWGDRLRKLLTPNRRHSAVCVLQRRFGVSERRARRFTGQSSSTQRLPIPAPPPDDEALTA